MGTCSGATFCAAGTVRLAHLLMSPLRLRASVALVKDFLVLLCQICQVLHLAILAEGNSLELALILVGNQELLVKLSLLFFVLLALLF